MDMDEIRRLTPSQLTDLMVDHYRKQISESVVTTEDVALFGSFYFMDVTTKQRKSHEAQAAADLLAEMAAPDFAYWTKLRSWTLLETCSLLCGLDPTLVKKDVDRIRRWASFLPMAKSFMEMELLLLREFDEDLPSGRMENSRERVTPEVVARWTKAIGVRAPDGLTGAFEVVNGPVGGTWPWGSYETELLRQVAAATSRFWVRFDPSQPDTAPVKSSVVAWLRERGVSDRTAEQIDTIIRAENLPKGPRRARI